MRPLGCCSLLPLERLACRCSCNPPTSQAPDFKYDILDNYFSNTMENSKHNLLQRTRHQTWRIGHVRTPAGYSLLCRLAVSPCHNMVLYSGQQEGLGKQGFHLQRRNFVHLQSRYSSEHLSPSGSSVSAVEQHP